MDSRKYSQDQAYLALDLEFNQPSGKIIQVGVCIGAASGTPAAYLTRQWYVDPEEQISPEIVALTGITQEDVSMRATPLAEVAQALSQLISEYDCFVNPVTWGGGDSERLLAAFASHGIAFPHFGRRWLDVKTMHSFLQLSAGRNPGGGLRSCMTRYKLPFIGTAHRADVDAFNTLRLFFALMQRQRAIDAVLATCAGIPRS